MKVSIILLFTVTSFAFLFANVNAEAFFEGILDTVKPFKWLSGKSGKAKTPVEKPATDTEGAIPPAAEPPTDDTAEPATNTDGATPSYPEPSSASAPEPSSDTDGAEPSAEKPSADTE